MNLKDKKIGLALGGGAVLGAAHIGVLQALHEQEIEINAISGTSIGALIGALYAFGKSPDEIEEIALGVNWKKLSSFSLSRFGVLSNEKIGDIISEYFGDVSFCDAQISLNMVATDITTGEKVILGEGSVKEAVMASCCLPGLFIPVEIDGRLLVDGGLVENVPCRTLQEHDIDYTIAVDLNAKHSFKKPEGIVGVLLNTFDFIFNASTSLQLKSAECIIRPDLSRFNAINTSQIEALIEAGYEQTLQQLQEGEHCS